jgi:calcineurin-like phosphoesterase family protein
LRPAPTPPGTCTHARMAEGSSHSVVSVARASHGEHGASSGPVVHHVHVFEACKHAEQALARCYSLFYSRRTVSHVWHADGLSHVWPVIIHGHLHRPIAVPPQPRAHLSVHIGEYGADVRRPAGLASVARRVYRVRAVW